MKLVDTFVVGGVDAHADTYHAAVLDQRGALLATASFPTTTPGYAQLLDWLRAFGEVDVIAVESTVRMLPPWSAICASMACGSSRSISRTRTPAVGGARATRSMPRWRPDCSSALW
jgi:hypothetical protein